MTDGTQRRDIRPGLKVRVIQKKHPCIDCSFCQFCSDTRCGICRPAGRGEKDKKKKEHKPLFRNY